MEHSWPEALDNVHRHLLGFEAVNRELQESEKRYRTIFEEAPVGMFQMSRGGQLLDLNGAMARILGFDSAGEVLAENFGTGYSSLGYLKHFKVNRLKIAHSFIKDIPVDADDAAITIAIIEMARALNLAVPAEGVEKADQLSFLRKQECYTIQGFYFSRPASVDKAGELLRTGFEHLI